MTGSGEEEKKALIIHMTRVVMRGFCSQAGTQDPLILVHPNADGTGSMTTIWESEAAAVRTLLRAVDADNTSGTASMSYEQQKQFAAHAVAASHDLPGVTYTIGGDFDIGSLVSLRGLKKAANWNGRCGFVASQLSADGRIAVDLLPRGENKQVKVRPANLKTEAPASGLGNAKTVLTFPTYKQLLKKLYADAKQLQQVQQTQQSHMLNNQYAARRFDAALLSAGQILGTVPLKVVNGVPHYGGIQY